MQYRFVYVRQYCKSVVVCYFSIEQYILARVEKNIFGKILCIRQRHSIAVGNGRADSRYLTESVVLDISLS